MTVAPDLLKANMKAQGLAARGAKGTDSPGMAVTNGAHAGSGLEYVIEVAGWSADAGETMSYCEHCEGQRFDRAQVLRALRAQRRQRRQSREADEAIAAAIKAVRGLEIPHLESLDELFDEEIVH